MSERVSETLGRAAYSALAGILTMMLFAPFCAGIAQAQAVAVPADEVAMDLGGIALCATVLALATEWVRGLVPQWRRGAKSDLAALAAIDHIRSVMGAPPYPPEVASALETLRKLAVATGGPSELAKTALRIVPVVLGIVAALAGWAPAVGDGSNPEMFGGVGAGLIASLFGGSLVSAVRSRLPSKRSRVAAQDDAS